ncbi:hypothetical protein ACFWD7_43250 [Streptomyces mirabilis]|uniref:hypothetical protein n=1 Tax=Streptomyces mirabilis TaxID=68239 RepID=UPI0036984B38
MNRSIGSLCCHSSSKRCSTKVHAGRGGAEAHFEELTGVLVEPEREPVQRAQVAHDVAADVGALLAQFTAAQDDREGVGVEEEDLHAGAVPGGRLDAAEEALGKLRAEHVGEGVEDLHVRGRAVDLGAEPLVVEPSVFADPAVLFLAADHGAGAADAAHRVPHHRGPKLLGMGEVGHQDEVAAARDDLFEQAQHVVGVAVGEETVRPEGERLGADADRLDRLDLQERFDVAAQHLGAHHHRVAARDERAGDLRVGAQIGGCGGDVVGGDAQVGLADELGPAEAVRAVGVADLALAREDQHRLRVLVLEAGEAPPFVHGDVGVELAGGMRVELHPDLVGRAQDVGLRGVLRQQFRHLLEVGLGQHLGLRERQPEDRVVRYGRRTGPVSDPRLVGSGGVGCCEPPPT